MKSCLANAEPFWSRQNLICYLHIPTVKCRLDMISNPWLFLTSSGVSSSSLISPSWYWKAHPFCIFGKCWELFTTFGQNQPAGWVKIRTFLENPIWGAPLIKAMKRRPHQSYITSTCHDIFPPKCGWPPKSSISPPWKKYLVLKNWEYSIDP